MREKRLEAGLSQRALGLRLAPQCSVQFISNIERGVTSLPAARIPEFAQVLQVPFFSLIDVMVSDYRAELVGLARELGAQDRGAALAEEPAA